MDILLKHAVQPVQSDLQMNDSNDQVLFDESLDDS